MAKLLLILLLFLALLMAAAVVAYHFWGWAGLGGVIVLLFLLGFGIKWAVGAALKKLFVTPFKMKGAVLKEAVVTVHAVTPAEPPSVSDEEEELDDAERIPGDSGVPDEPEEREEGEEEVRRPNRWYHVDLTVTPTAGEGGGFTMWEPGELGLAGASAVSTDSIDEMGEDDEVGEIGAVQIWQDEAWVDDEGMKFPGPQRLRLHVGLHEGVTSFRLRYYFEVFGNVSVPG